MRVPLPFFRVLSAGLLAVGAQCASASPDGAAGDALTAWLAERGLAGAAAPAQDAASGHRASELVVAAMNFLEVSYRFGGTTVEDGFDCSAFTRHVFQVALGLALPRSADDQARTAALVEVAREELNPGDLVFFNTLGRTFSHVGIYIGNSRFIHAPRTGSRVRVDNMGDRYWSPRFTGARRIAALARSVQAPVLPSPLLHP